MKINSFFLVITLSFFNLSSQLAAKDKRVALPLSERTTTLIEAFFKDSFRHRIISALVNEVGDNLPFCNRETPERMDRIRFAVIKLIVEDWRNFDYVIREAKTEWRDLLMAAGFGYSADEHNRWYDKVGGSMPVLHKYKDKETISF